MSPLPPQAYLTIEEDGLMNDKDQVDTLVCEGVSVHFPLTTPALRWRLLFGEVPNQWHEALVDVNLRVPRGRIVGVIGRNGAGKSTLLRTLADVYPLASGRVVRLGPVSSLFELGGTGGLFITGRQYVQRWLQLQSISRQEWPALIEEIREFSELGSRLEDRIYTYSAGMKARLYFSAATSVSHDIYLIDEVLSVGDEHFQAKCWKRVRERLQGGVSGVLVTHDWAAILKLCESACELEQGRIVALGNAEDVICNYLDIKAQLGTSRLAEFAHDCPEFVEAETGETWSCNIPVVVNLSTQVFFNYSIEKLAPGFDWQILIMGNEVLIASEPGQYLAHIQVPEFPLPGGDYRLNVFVTGARPERGGARPSYDLRSWTSGNSIRLTVRGEQQSALVVMPLVMGRHA
jgi:lipopolysaccharide transport system ATP-binding protein